MPTPLSRKTIKAKARRKAYKRRKNVLKQIPKSLQSLTYLKKNHSVLIGMGYDVPVAPQSKKNQERERKLAKV